MLYYFVFLVFSPLYCLQTVVCVNISRHVSCRWVVILHLTPRAIIISILVGTNLWAFAELLSSSHVFQMQTASPVVSRLTKDSIGRYTGTAVAIAVQSLNFRHVPTALFVAFNSRFVRRPWLTELGLDSVARSRLFMPPDKKGQGSTERRPLDGVPLFGW